MSDGWIKLHRKIQDCFLWQDKPYDKARAWIDLLLLAMHHEKKILIDNEIVIIPRGSFMTSIVKLSDRWGWSRNKVLRYLNVLENEQMLNTKRTPKGTLVTVVKYDDYQVQDIQGDTTDGTTDGTTDDTTDGTQNKNIKNDKNILTVSKDTVSQTESVRQAIDEWNTLEKYGINPVKRITQTSDRYIRLKTRIKEYGIDNVLKAIDNIRHSKFLQGKSDGKRCWVITFDWFIRPNNFPKVLDGQYNYDRDSGGSQKSITDMQLEKLAEKQKSDMQNDLLSDEEINRICDEEGW